MITPGAIQVWALRVLCLVLLGVALANLHSANAARTESDRLRTQLAAVQLQAQTAVANASETARENEHLAGKANERLSHDLQAERVAATGLRADVERRLRSAANAARTAASTGAASAVASAGCATDVAPVACLPDAVTGDLVSLAADAQRDGQDLAGLQRYVREVMPFCQSSGQNQPGAGDR